MKDMCWMVHAILEGPIKVREGFGAAAEAHILAKVISTFFAVITMITHDTGFNGDSLAWYKIFDPGTDSGHYATSFVTKHERRSESEITVPPVQIIMY